MAKTLHERFWAKVKRNAPDACWPWVGVILGNGYGSLTAFNKADTAHRVSWMLANGPIPTGLFVCHKCDVRSCVNPAHLFIGTAKDNTRDMIAKGRARFFGICN
jgi:hypothetical protein